MRKLYQNRHLWLVPAYRTFSSLGVDFGVPGSLNSDLTAHGRRILSSDNSTFPDGRVPDCVPPSIDEFPGDFLTQEQRVRGGLIAHFLIIAYICCSLAIVCDKYFVPCLKVISSYFNVPQDIAGATFMAVGTSSPELFSSAIGAFVTEGDIGVGTVVGSAVFNILAVTGAAGLAVGTAAVELDWYPISRDCTMYIITISTLVVIIHDNIVTWYEALILICMFVFYLTLLYFNCHVQNATTKTAKHVTRWWQKRRHKGISLTLLPKALPDVDETSALLVASRLVQQRYQSTRHAPDSSSGASSLVASGETTASEGGDGSDTLAVEGGGRFRPPPLLVPQIIVQKYVTVKDEPAGEEEEEDEMDKAAHELESSLEVNLWKPPQSSWWRRLYFFAMWPANLLFSLTVPRCNEPGRTKLFPATFLVSIAWLGMLSYLCFWMVAIVGYTLGIPDTVSGITILAAGTSVPELVSSVIVVKNGLGNMALCNLLGSNIFDILFCLGVPWLAKTLMNTSTRSLVINSSALTYTTLILLAAVVLFYLTLAACRWRLTWRYGTVALILYAAFLVVASMYESNVFGDFNPPACSS